IFDRQSYQREPAAPDRRLPAPQGRELEGAGPEDRAAWTEAAPWREEILAGSQVAKALSRVLAIGLTRDSLLSAAASSPVLPSIGPPSPCRMPRPPPRPPAPASSSACCRSASSPMPCCISTHRRSVTSNR